MSRAINPVSNVAGHEILVLQKRYQKITIGLETRDLESISSPAPAA